MTYLTEAYSSSGWSPNLKFLLEILVTMDLTKLAHKEMSMHWVSLNKIRVSALNTNFLDLPCNCYIYYISCERIDYSKPLLTDSNFIL